jgi:replicative DNA helicase
LLSYEIAEGRSDKQSELDTLIQSLADGTDCGSNIGETSADFVTDDLQILIDDAVSTPGLRWRLNTMNQMLGSLRKGDFGFIFARPETGKTTFLASEITYMATQLKEEDGPILWINNEEQGSKVMLRVYQAALGVDLTTLYSDIDHHKQEYQRLTHGKLKLYDSGIIHKSTVEKLCKQYKPSLIIFDQIGKITGFDKDREDLVQGAIYQWARELAKEYCPVIGVCQADGSGEGVRWLTMSNVADAKTAKQAEADWILGIGKVNDAGYDNLRFLHLSKNKLTGDKDTIPDQRHGRRETLIEPGIARYKDI